MNGPGAVPCCELYLAHLQPVGCLQRCSIAMRPSTSAAGDQQSKPGLLGKMMGSLRRNKAANDVTAFEGEPTSGSDEEGQSKDDDEVPQWRKAQSAASGASSSAKVRACYTALCG